MASKLNHFVAIVNSCVNNLKHSVLLNTELLHTAVNYFQKELQLIFCYDALHTRSEWIKKFKEDTSFNIHTFLNSLAS